MQWGLSHLQVFWVGDFFFFFLLTPCQQYDTLRSRIIVFTTAEHVKPLTHLFFKPALKIRSCTAGLMAQSHTKSSGCKYLLVKSTVAVSFVHQTGCNTFKKRKLPYNTYFKQKLWTDALMLKEERTFPFTTNIATLVHVNKQVPMKIIYWPDKLCRKKTSLTRNQQRF